MTARLHARVDGPADGSPDPPVLLLGSSLGTTGTMWQPQVAALSQRCRVVRYDHRGHGESEVPPGPYRIDDLGADVLALLDRLSIERVRYAGLSLGGMVGMWLAAHAPQRVERLALLCTSARLRPAQPWHERASAVLDGGMAAVADAVVGRWFTPGFAAEHPDLVTAHRDGLLAVPPTGYAACCEAIAAMDLLADLPQIACPTLVIAAQQDPAIPPEHSRVIVSAVPGARLEVLDDAAHLANLQQPDAVSALLLDHLTAD
ncbi:3-oxoadipate enol-lactonase [Angustibacter sp. McL0619]|uniref:3-oxoadipate enol-lactonase n=1 Tax=Angustibacter sp. McL0619 TaxID=3415676 RepID=UPI003CEA39E0